MNQIQNTVSWFNVVMTDVGPESSKILIHICIGLKAQIEDEDVFEDKHVVSQRPTVEEKGDNVNRSSPGIYVEDEPSLD